MGTNQPRPNEGKRMLLIAAGAVATTLLVTAPTAARAAWQELAAYLGLVGPPERVSANVLSEHEIEALDGMAAQSQAELLLERTINHFAGASAEISRRVESWRGRIELNDRLNGLFTTALNSDDLRVRAAAIEVDIAARGLEKTTATVDRLQPDALEGEQGPRVNALWNIALLGNRGVDPDRAFRLLMTAIDDANVNVRYWTVEGLAYLGTDATIEPLLNVFHDDPSPMIRERAACSLAQSGMLSEKQRRTAVPRFLDYAEDPSLDAETRKWVFQALRDITGQTLPHDAAAWRTWYHGGGKDWRPVTRDGAS